MRSTRPITFLSSILLLMVLSEQSGSTAQPPLPNPVLVFLGQEFYETGGKSWTRYQYAIDNAEAYPAELFAPAPTLPPCGANTRSSRAWVDIYDQRGKRLYGFCALGSGKEKIWFNMETSEVPPSWVYIEMLDRKTDTKYKSNLAETCL
jgi:hypothetical protein